MKATAKYPTNLKSTLSGGEVVKVMQKGDYLYGTAGATDMMDFYHYYLASSVMVELGKKCKAFIGTNLILTNEAEPTIPTDPIDPPTPPAILSTPDEITCRWETGKDANGLPIYGAYEVYTKKP
jgi:hypothetical protein